MKNGLGEFSSDYEETLDKLSSQITELFSEIHYYKALVTEKENQIIRLTTENSQLKTQIQNMTQPTTPASYPSQLAQPILTTPQQVTSTFTPQTDSRVNKRQCPECGAAGFAIREVDDKSRIISYVPRRIYAKKYACTKCRYEFSWE
ncbi:MAG: hypothetical protein ACW972_05230 [Promethearchaeota archaeon]|jgi:regulator of replication initiation timing